MAVNIPQDTPTLVLVVSKESQASHRTMDPSCNEEFGHNIQEDTCTRNIMVEFKGCIDIAKEDIVLGPSKGQERRILKRMRINIYLP